MGSDAQGGLGRSRPGDIEAEIERTRARIAEAIDRLRDDVAQATDWRGMMARKPLVVLGAAAVIGFWLGRRK